MEMTVPRSNAPPHLAHVLVQFPVVDQLPETTAYLHTELTSHLRTLIDTLGIMLEHVNEHEHYAVYDVRATESQLTELQDQCSRTITLAITPCELEGDEDDNECSYCA